MAGRVVVVGRRPGTLIAASSVGYYGFAGHSDEAKAVAAGYQFRFPALEPALRDILQEEPGE
jgi:NAD dependent epimerase/dehydratase family enzyme